jgi:beta-glucosidase
MDERTLQEIYLPAFKAAVQEGGTGAVMTSYNLVNGTHSSQNGHLIKDILKGQWKFDGFVMSDWTSTYDAVAAANAGLDLEMPSGALMNQKNLLPAIKQGSVKESTIDDKIRRMLRVMFRFGFFDRPQDVPSLPLYSPESRLVALRAARKGIVLLKNKDHLLPLDRAKIKSVAVLGPNAHPAVTGGGGSSTVKPFRSVSVLDGMIQVAGNGVSVYYHPGLQVDMAALLKRGKFFHGKQVGLRGEYFSNTNLEGEPALTRMDERIDFDWANGPAPGFSPTKYSVRWTGTIHADQQGLYGFVVRGDDGFRLYVDNHLVINQWRDQAATTETVQRFFLANTNHEIKLEYYQNEGGATISFGWGKIERSLEKRAVDLAAKADAAVVCVGFNARTESEGADRKFELTPEEEQLINEVAAVNPRTIVVLTAGGNVSMVNWIDHVGGLLHSWYPGQEGGTAIAEILFGDVNPSGKLPVSFEKKWEDNACFNSYYDRDGDKHVRYSEGVFLGYRHFDSSGVEPMFPFGFGLSYTTFEYKNLTLSSNEIRQGEKLKVSFDVTNSGQLEGAESAQLYIRDIESSEPRPPKELKGISKVVLKPGETKRLEFEIGENTLSFFSTKKNGWIAEPGEFEVLVGSSSRDIRLRKVFTLKG